MAETTNIAWTDMTFNPWIGCSKVHAGCANCYAEADMDHRRHRVKWGPNGTRSRTSDSYWKQTLKWNRDAENAGVRKRVFCASLADVFEDWDGRIINSRGETCFRCGQCGERWSGKYEEDPTKPATRCIRFGEGCCGFADDLPMTMNDLRRDLFDLIDATPNLDWLLLTKRPENIFRMWAQLGNSNLTVPVRKMLQRTNVWLGTSISDQGTADAAIPHLLGCRHLAPVLFLSIEPLLGPIDFSRFVVGSRHVVNAACDRFRESHDDPTFCKCGYGAAYHRRGLEAATNIDWIIVGGESGPNARPCNVEWIRSIVRQCQSAGVSTFVKQLGSNVIGSHRERMEMIGEPFSHGADAIVRWKLQDSKGGDMLEFPEDLQVQEFPR